MVNQKVTPGVPKDLLEWLEQTFPDRCPDPKMSDREVWIAVGKAAVVRKLRDLFEKQVAKALLGD